MQPNYRVIKISNKYYPQFYISSKHTWEYFYYPDTDKELWYDNPDEAYNRCVEDSNTNKIEVIMELTINKGKVIEKNIL
jgi:hypothetical protein